MKIVLRLQTRIFPWPLLQEWIETTPPDSGDLKKQVDKVLKGLGNPEPPLDLLDVRELLKLDVQYFSSTDTSFLQESISRLTIAGKQILKRPSLLIDVVKKAKLSGLWIPDHKRILLDKNAPPLKHRWIETHEIGHGLAPWHSRYLFGDDSESLGLACHEKLESEANFAAGQLLFLRDRFADEANDSPPSISNVQKLSRTFGNTLTSTLWRFVEETHKDKWMVGVVSQHPHRLKSDFDENIPCKYLIESAGFRAQFSKLDVINLFRNIKSYCSDARGGPLGTRMLSLIDDNDESHLFRFESFFNGHDCLTLGVHVRKASVLFID